MKKALHLAICMLAALLAVQPSLAAANCGERMHCAAQACAGCCGQMAGMTSSAAAMQCHESGGQAIWQDAASSTDGERDSRCYRAVEDRPQYIGAGQHSHEPVMLVPSRAESVPSPGMADRPAVDQVTDAGAPARYLLFRVFRI